MNVPQNGSENIWFNGGFFALLICYRPRPHMCCVWTKHQNWVTCPSHNDWRSELLMWPKHHMFPDSLLSLSPAGLQGGRSAAEPWSWFRWRWRSPPLPCSPSVQRRASWRPCCSETSNGPLLRRRAPVNDTLTEMSQISRGETLCPSRLINHTGYVYQHTNASLWGCCLVAIKHISPKSWQQIPL